MSEGAALTKFEFDKDPSTLTDADLVASHALLHEYWQTKQEKGEVVVGGESRSNEDLINYHALIIQEMMMRGFSHTPQDEFDEKTAPFLKAEDLEPFELIIEDGDCFEKGVGQPFGSPAGKSKVAKRLIEMIPPHKRYIEPFCGGAAVFFAKEPSEEEILCDADPEIITALRFLQSMKPAELERLKRFNWTGSRGRFEDVKAHAPQDRVEKFYRFKYLMRFSFGCDRKSWAKDREGLIWDNFGRLEKAQRRLQNAELILGDGMTVIARRTTDSTFTFMDPPYWHTPNPHVMADEFDGDRLNSVIKQMRGSWLMTLMNDEAKEIPAVWKRRILFSHLARNSNSKEGQNARRAEWLLANYTPDRFEKSADLALVNPSGVKLGEPIHLSEVLPLLKSYKLRSPYIYLVGGLVINGQTEGDIDILIKDDSGLMDPRLKKILEFRVGRMLPEKLSKRVHFHYDELGGPFTDNIPLFDFTIERVNPENRVFEMSLEKQAYPDEGVKYGYVIQHHRRGKTTHADLRIESAEKDSLIGWTMADMIAGAEKESVDEEARKALELPEEDDMTQAQKDRWGRKMFTLAQERDGERKNFKVDWESGRFQMRETRAGTVVPAQLRAFHKARQPKAWLNVEGVTPPFPAPGATKEFRGVFTLLDGTKKHGGDAWAEYGRQAPQFREYFLFGGTVKGRLVFRQLSREALEKGMEDEELGKQIITLPPGIEEEGEAEDLMWTAIQPLDQTPQFLSKRAVDQGDMPPVGKSGLPQVVKAKIPVAFRYWEKTGAAAKKLRDELVEQIKDGELELDFNKLMGVPAIEKAVPAFILISQRWRSREETGAAPKEQWRIVIKRDGQLTQWSLWTSPLKLGAASGTLELGLEETIWTVEGEVEPATPLNPAKESSFVEHLDSGPVTLVEDGDVFKRFEFRGKALKGIWIAQRNSPQDAIWKFECDTGGTGGGDAKQTD